MKIYKSVISTVLVLVMLLGMVPVAAMAAESTVAGTVRMQVSSASAQPGGTVDVLISVTENPGVASLKFSVEYDSCMTLTNVELGSNFGSYITTPVPYTNPQPITVISPLQDVAGTGVLATLTFAVSGEAEDGYAAGVRISHDPDDVFNGSDAPVALSAENGTVFVYHKLPGDVNGDGKLNPKDPVALFRHVAGWPEVVDEDALDYNGDTKINTKDAIDLFRYVAGWEGIVGHRHVHRITPVAKKDATCTVDGNTAHYCCEKCGKLYSDEGAEKEIEAADTVIPATKHAGYLQKVEAKEPTVDAPGNDAYWKCSLCGLCYSDEAAKNQITEESTVIPAKAYYTITFMDSKNWPQGNKVRFAQDEALELTTYYPPAVTGYEFGGWYTKSTFGDANKLDNIPAGNTEDKTVYAKWDATEYTITYKNAADNNSNPKTYTVENEIMLADPKWIGLEFSCWSDADGNRVDKIEKGTTGNIQLEANWKYQKNQAVSNPDKYTYVGGALDSQSRYYFIYDIGTIENVVLDEIYGHKYNGNSEFTYTESETYKVERQEAQTVAQTVANSVIKSEQWENTSNWVSYHEEGTNLGAKYCPEIEIEKIKVKALEISGGWAEVDSDTYTETEVQMDSEVIGTEVSNQTLSTISFVEEKEKSKQVNLNLRPDISPTGFYSYVRAADIKVYAIVTYDPANGEYYLDIYSMVYRVFDTTLFELVGDEQYSVNIEKCNQLDFEIPYEQIPEMFYTVEYHANGGSGKMLKSVHELGETSALLPYGFKRTGYTFGGWKTTADGDAAIYTDASSIRDIANAGETVTLYAHWNKNAYTVKYNGNKPSNASSSVQNVPAYSDCSYDTAVTLGDAPSLIGWTFEGWYRDAACTVKVGDGEQVIANANLTAEFKGTVTLYAKWMANTYTVTYNANGGTNSMLPDTFKYDTGSKLSTNTFVRPGYTFIGWSEDPDALDPQYVNGQEVFGMNNGDDVALYAVWLKTSVEFSTANLPMIGTDKLLDVTWGMDSSVDLTRIYKYCNTAKISLVLDFENFSMGTVNPKFVIKNGSGTELANWSQSVSSDKEHLDLEKNVSVVNVNSSINLSGRFNGEWVKQDYFFIYSCTLKIEFMP